MPARDDDVLRAVADVLFAKGYDAVTLADVAARLQASGRELPAGDASKEELLLKLVEGVLDRWEAMLDEVRAQELSALETVRLFVERHVEWSLSDVRTVTVCLRDWRRLTGEALRRTRERGRASETAFRELIDAAKRDGAVHPGLETRHAARYVLAALHAVPQRFAVRSVDAVPLIAERYAEMAVGLLVGTPARRETRPRPRAWGRFVAEPIVALEADTAADGHVPG